MRKLIALAVVIGAFAAPSTASAHGWHACNYGYQTTQARYDGYYSGDYIDTWGLRARSPMNCSSARYAIRTVLRRWQHKLYLPAHFSDGYVDWYGFLASGHTWRGTAEYEEFDSNTAFKFHFFAYGD